MAYFEVLEHVGATYKIRIRPGAVTNQSTYFGVPTQTVIPFVGTLDRIVFPTTVSAARFNSFGVDVFELDLPSGSFPSSVPVGMLNYASNYVVAEGENVAYLDFEGREFPDPGEIINMGTFMESPVVMPNLDNPKMEIKLHDFTMPDGTTYTHALLANHGYFIREYNYPIKLTFRG